MSLESERRKFMFAGIVGLIAGIMCAFPFLVVSIYGKDSKEPISFWSGDTSLKSKVKNLPEYNKKMSSLYKKCAIAFLIMGVSFIFSPAIGLILIGLYCTLGVYIVYRIYKRILDMYS